MFNRFNKISYKIQLYSWWSINNCMQLPETKPSHSIFFMDRRLDGLDELTFVIYEREPKRERSRFRTEFSPSITPPGANSIKMEILIRGGEAAAKSDLALGRS
jgi:hypothetical protein